MLKPTRNTTGKTGGNTGKTSKRGFMNYRVHPASGVHTGTKQAIPTIDASDWIDGDFEVEIFRSGKWPGSAGEIPWTREDVREMAAVYNRNYPTIEAPACLGHPDPDAKAPAYGWLRSCFTKAGKDHEGNDCEILIGRFRKFYKPFLEAVKAEVWKNRSVRVDRQTKQIYHVAWLGASLPAVPGMAPAQFATATGATITVDNANTSTPAPTITSGMNEEQAAQMLTLLQSIVDAQAQQSETLGEILTAVTGEGEAEPEAEGTATEPSGDANNQNTTSNAVSNSKTAKTPVATATPATQATANAQPDISDNAEVKRLNSEIARLAREAETARHEAWVDSKTVRDRILPKERAGILDTLSDLSRIPHDHSNAKNPSPVEKFKRSIENREPHDYTEELITDDADYSDNASTGTSVVVRDKKPQHMQDAAGIVAASKKSKPKRG